MTSLVSLEIAGVGAVCGKRFGPAAVEQRYPAWAMPAAGVSAPENLVAEFKRRTQQRYIDAAAETGLLALHGAIEASGLSQSVIDSDPVRTGLLLATATGPEATRRQYLETYAKRGGKSASATLFTNCGYNIVGSLLARSRNIRGPVLTFGADRNWSRLLVTTARRLLAAGKADRVFIGRAEADGAVILGLVRPGDGPGRLAVYIDDSLNGIAPRQAAPTPDTVPLWSAPASPSDPDQPIWRLASLWWQGA